LDISLQLVNRGWIIGVDSAFEVSPHKKVWWG